MSAGSLSIFSCNYRSPVARLIDFDAGHSMPLSHSPCPLSSPFIITTSPQTLSLIRCTTAAISLLSDVRDAVAFAERDREKMEERVRKCVKLPGKDSRNLQGSRMNKT